MPRKDGGARGEFAKDGDRDPGGSLVTPRSKRGSWSFSRVRKPVQETKAEQRQALTALMANYTGPIRRLQPGRAMGSGIPAYRGVRRIVHDD